MKSESHSICPTLYNPPGLSIRGILQARIVEWVAIPFSRRSSQPRDQTQVSRIAGGFFYHLSHHESPHYDKEIIIISATSVLEKGKALKHFNLWLIAENQLIMLLSCSINRRKKLVFCIKTIGSIVEGQSANSMAVLFDMFGGRMSPSRKKVINMLKSYNMCSVINILSMHFNNSLIRAALFPPPSADTDN